ncbi:MAG: hypothetical protein ACOCWG_00375 [bacterium]
MTLISSNIKDEIKKYPVISFDIFDTLILRPYLNPSDMFFHMERILSIKNYAQKRIKAENKARKNSVEDEICFDNIYENAGRTLQKIAQYEIDFEKRVCQRNPEIYDIYRYALNLNKRIIFVSDMYLPENTIREILIQAGFNTYEHLYLSSKYKKRKHSGELYDLVIEKTNVLAGEILHIGDNKRNDLDKALEKGLAAIHYPKVIDRFLEENPNLHVLLKDNYDPRFDTDKLSISIILGINSLIWIENMNANYWSQLGSLYAGPFLYYFSKWIYDNAKNKKIKNIALVARDGYNLINIFNIFNKNKELNPQYVYLPRHVSETANFNTVKDLETFFKELGKTTDALYTFISNFVIENNQLNDEWEKYIKNHQSISHQDLKEFVISHQKEFIEISQLKKEVVYQYLEQMGLFSGDLIVVDSSCTKARPQNLLHNLINEKRLNISLFGYYYKVNRPQKKLHQIDIRPEVNRKYQTDKWDLMEFFMSSPEKPILSIEKQGNRFHPVYKNIDESEHERMRIKASEFLSDGIKKFAQKSYNIFEDIEIIKDLDTTVSYVNNYINNPTVKDISHIKHLYHSVNNDNTYTPLILGDNRTEKNFRKIHGQRVQVTRISPEFENFFVGRVENNIMNCQGNEHLALNVTYMDRLPSKKDEALIFVIDENNITEKIGSTKMCNFQKGAFIQFIPDRNNLIIYADYDVKSGKIISILYDLKTRNKKNLSFAVLNVSDDGNKGLCIDSIFLNDHSSSNGLGYIKTKKPGLKANQENDIANILLMDLESGNTKKILSLSQILAFAGIKKNNLSDKIYIHDLCFNPGSNKLIIKLIINQTTTQKTSLSLISDLNGDKAKLLSSAIFDFSWKDKDSIFVTSNNITGAKKQTNETLYQINLLKDDYSSLDNSFFSGKGNISYHPKGRYLLFEPISNRRIIPYRKLQIYDIKMKKGITLGYFYSDPDFYRNNDALRCELKPRWSVCGKHITFDSIHEGFRGIYKIDSEEAIKELERKIENISEKEIEKIITPFPVIENLSIIQRLKKKSTITIKKGLKFIIRGNMRKIVKKKFKGFLHFI